MTTGTNPIPAEGLPARIGINAFNQQVCRVRKPQTCIIPELYEAAERHKVLLTMSPLKRVCGWLLFPAHRMAEVVNFEEMPPSVLMLGMSATRRVQLEALAGINACFEEGVQE